MCIHVGESDVGESLMTQVKTWSVVIVNLGSNVVNAVYWFN